MPSCSISVSVSEIQIGDDLRPGARAAEPLAGSRCAVSSISWGCASVPTGWCENSCSTIRRRSCSTLKKRGKEADYEAKTVTRAGRRYIVCRNHQEAEKDAADRASIVAALERQLAKGDKALVGNTGYRRYLKREITLATALDDLQIGRVRLEVLRRKHMAPAHAGAHTEFRFVPNNSLRNPLQT